MNLSYVTSLYHFIPELIATATMVLLILVDAVLGDENSKVQKKHYIPVVSIFGLLGSLFFLCSSMGQIPRAIFSDAIIIDSFSTMMKMIMVVGTIGVIYLGQNSKDIYRSFRPEFAILSIGILIGGMLLSSANNMLTLYIGIETLSILSYALAALKKHDDRSAEAGLKYSLYGGVSAGLMLFGLSHIYGVLGTIGFSGMLEKLALLSGADLAIIIPSFLLVFVGLGYKIASVPFHMWAPDVYEGSPIPVTTFFAIVPKLAGMAVLIRVSMVFFSGDENILRVSWVSLLTVISALTMTVGNITAINQNSVKRMLAYSSISHAGMMMMGVLVLNEIGIRSVLFYAVTYLFMTLVAFTITSFVTDEYGNDHFSRFNGLVKRYPLVTICMAITMFSLAGLPPLSGFVAKFNILSALIQKGYLTLAVVAAVNSVISLYYYMKIIRQMIFEESSSDEKILRLNPSNHIVIGLLSTPVVFLGIFWEEIMIYADGAKIFVN